MKHTMKHTKNTVNPARAAFWAKVRQHSKPIDWESIAPARPARLTGAHRENPASDLHPYVVKSMSGAHPGQQWK